MRHNYRARAPPLESPRAANYRDQRSGARVPQLEREKNPHATAREKPEQTVRLNEKIPHASTKIPCATAKTRHTHTKIRKTKKLNKYFLK